MRDSKVKVVVFLGDGMADGPLDELGGKTPLESASTPAMDSIAAEGASGTFLSLPDGFPTSSDVANLSVLGFDLPSCYPGRGPLEAVARGVEIGSADIAWRCNLAYVADGRLIDYASGHLDDSLASEIVAELAREFGGEDVSFHHGVSYRGILVLHGGGFSKNIGYHKPDSSQGISLSEIGLYPLDPGDVAAVRTVEFLERLKSDSLEFLSGHPLTRGLDNPSNMIWPWSPGGKPKLPAFESLYGLRGAVVTAVDVIAGIAKCAGMEVLEVPGATGFVDTNYEGKARAAIKAVENFDFVYLHVEAMDECSHMGDLDLKISAIEDFDSRIVAPVLNALDGENAVFAVLPDHPVPVKLRKHTRTPVPVAVAGPGVERDAVERYSEVLSLSGGLGAMRGGGLMDLLTKTGSCSR